MIGNPKPKTTKGRGRKLLLLILLPSALAVAVCVWPSFRFRTCLVWASLRSALHSFGPAQYSFNTFDDHLAPADIAKLYRTGCSHLDHMKDGTSRRTYRWETFDGYPSISSVAQYPKGYLAITAFEGNDSYGVLIDIGPGAFPANYRKANPIDPWRVNSFKFEARQP